MIIVPNYDVFNDYINLVWKYFYIRLNGYLSLHFPYNSLREDNIGYFDVIFHYTDTCTFNSHMFDFSRNVTHTFKQFNNSKSICINN